MYFSLFSSLQILFTLVNATTFSNLTMPATAPLLDVLIIGGGPGGLSVATGLARQLYTAVVFDSGLYRNARSQHMHNVATWDHRSPAEFRAKARDDLLARYNTIQFVNTTIESVSKTPTGVFQTTDSTGKVWEGRKLVLATGIRDVYPEIEGYDDVWGKAVYVYSLNTANLPAKVAEN
jgi:thioredoxin reductase